MGLPDYRPPSCWKAQAGIVFFRAARAAGSTLLFAGQPPMEKSMNKLLAAVVASTLLLGATGAIAADPAKPAASMAKLERPASVAPDKWSKMTDAEKQKAVDDAKAAKPAAAKTATAPPKEKKGGC
jgi:hypothetical protein